MQRCWPCTWRHYFPRPFAAIIITPPPRRTCMACPAGVVMEVHHSPKHCLCVVAVTLAQQQRQQVHRPLPPFLFPGNHLHPTAAALPTARPHVGHCLCVINTASALQPAGPHHLRLPGTRADQSPPTRSAQRTTGCMGSLARSVQPSGRGTSLNRSTSEVCMCRTSSSICGGIAHP